MKVAVIGAAGGIGQPLSLLLKLSPLVDELTMYDLVNTPGIAADLNHIDTDAKVTGCLADEGFEGALQNADLVVIPAGIPRKPGMTRDDLFAINGGIISNIAENCAKSCPKAHILVISNPVNSTVAIFAEVFKKCGVYDPRRLYGVTTLDLVRANSFISELSGGKLQSKDLNVTVIGGHSGETIVPIFSHNSNSQLVSFYESLSMEQRDSLIHRVQFGGDEIVTAKKGQGSATLSMAYSGFRLAESLMKAIAGETNIIESAYIQLDQSIQGSTEVKSYIASKGLTDVEYISLPIKLGPRGVESIEFDILNHINENEEELLSTCLEQLKGNIAKGVDFVKGANATVQA
ncbi:hypothetical protein WICPIJ_006566 [Wickerhamomyces pijperi]|uniref:Malate dehydrogenase n=1 Tax=Wickerhamomyces pijperi TaxID=599730 RepID=A0A9P8TK42_WICPI|nr:hypothetical protein WICPIJ_006566 [Wickerhamomyces pijperi]